MTRAIRLPHFGWTLLADEISKLSKASRITEQAATRHIVTAAYDGALYTRGRPHHAKGYLIAIAPAAWLGMDADPVMSRLCPPNPGSEMQEPFLDAMVCEVEIHNASLAAWKAGEARPPIPIMQPIPSALLHNVLVWRELYSAADTKMAATAPASELPTSAETATASGDFATDHSGAPGAPSSSHLVSAEFASRLQSGAIEGNLARQAGALETWLKDTHPKLRPMAAGTIENLIRAVWNSRPHK